MSLLAKQTTKSFKRCADVPTSSKVTYMTASTKRSNARRSVFGKEAPKPSLRLVQETAHDGSNAPPRRDVVLKARTPGQRHYVKELQEGISPFVVATGPAGCGKTFVAVTYAIQQLRAGNIKRIIISRPNVGAGDDLGYMPGNLVEKMAVWTRPIIDVFAKFYSPYQIEAMIKSETLEIAPLVFMRGRTFEDAIVILDESQNTTKEQMQMALTRIGEGSRFIITGDIEQHDRGTGVSGLKDLMVRHGARYAEVDETETVVKSSITIFNLGTRDVVRHPAIAEILSLYA